MGYKGKIRYLLSLKIPSKKKINNFHRKNTRDIFLLIRMFYFYVCRCFACVSHPCTTHARRPEEGVEGDESGTCCEPRHVVLGIKPCPLQEQTVLSTDDLSSL